MRANVIPERDVQAQVLEGLALLGIEAQRQNTGMAMNPNGQAVRFGKKGNADVSATMPRGPHRGKRLEIEVKRKGKTPTPAQWKRIREVNASGGLSFWTDDSARCLEIVRKLLDGWRIEIDDDGNQWITDDSIGEQSR